MFRSEFYSAFTHGAKVKVRINDLELSDRFLGSNQDMTLLEADITLIGTHKDLNFDRIKTVNTGSTEEKIGKNKTDKPISE